MTCFLKSRTQLVVKDRIEFCPIIEAWGQDLYFKQYFILYFNLINV